MEDDSVLVMLIVASWTGTGKPKTWTLVIDGYEWEPLSLRDALFTLKAHCELPVERRRALVKGTAE